MIRSAAIAIGLFSILLLAHQTILAGTLEKKGEADPLLRLKQEQQEARNTKYKLRNTKIKTQNTN